MTVDDDLDLWGIYFPVATATIGYFLAWAQFTDRGWSYNFHYSDLVSLTLILAGIYIVLVSIVRLMNRRESERT